MGKDGKNTKSGPPNPCVSVYSANCLGIFDCIIPFCANITIPDHLRLQPVIILVGYDSYILKYTDT